MIIDNYDKHVFSTSPRDEINAHAHGMRTDMRTVHVLHALMDTRVPVHVQCTLHVKYIGTG